jgi:hypothetical protein
VNAGRSRVLSVRELVDQHRRERQDGGKLRHFVRLHRINTVRLRFLWASPMALRTLAGVVTDGGIGGRNCGELRLR